MNRLIFAAVAAAALASGTARAAELETPASGFGRLDHVFLILMENQTNTDILGNPNAPFINDYAGVANQAADYFAVGHPSAPNYLEIVGGSNFGLTDDFWPNWSGAGCVDHSSKKGECDHAFGPVAEDGIDNPVAATADSQACNKRIMGDDSAPAANNCALHDYPAAPFTAKTIADQLVAKKLSWRSYQESLPAGAPKLAGVNYSDGIFSNLSPAAAFAPGPLQKLYVVKHNPFAYFEKVEAGRDKELSLGRVEGFEGLHGLWAALQSEEEMASFNLIAPNQCHNMHGFVAGSSPICSSATPEESALMIAAGDAEVAKLVNGIEGSRAWKRGRNAIILVWDENDYSNASNRVVMLVETNYAKNGKKSEQPYDHFSLLRTLEAGFGLPCLNHACDPTSKVMDDVFGE